MSSRDESFELFLSLKAEEERKIIAEFVSGEHPFQPWEVLPAGPLAYLLSDFSRFGFVRNKRMVDRFANQLVRNIIRLEFNTELMGHSDRSQESLRETVEESGFDLDPEELERTFPDYCTDPGTGQWRISDYALDKLVPLAIEILATNEPTKTLLLVDRVLNVTHMRSDLSALFVEGGRQTLDSIFEN